MEFLQIGIKIFTVQDVIQKFGLQNEFNAVQLEYQKPFSVGEFQIIGLKAFHDVETAAFIINHPECGNVLFATDTFKFPYKLSMKLNNALIEANYCEQILKDRLNDFSQSDYLPNRVIKSHMSAQECLRTLQNQDLSELNNIVLVHLSDGNSHAERFHQLISENTGKTVYIAETGLEINFDKTPF
jgi:hypothetical protein